MLRLVLVVRFGAEGKAGPVPRLAPDGPACLRDLFRRSRPVASGPHATKRRTRGTLASSRGLPAPPGGLGHRASAVPFGCMPPVPQFPFVQRAAVWDRPRRPAVCPRKGTERGEDRRRLERPHALIARKSEKNSTRLRSAIHPTEPGPFRCMPPGGWRRPRRRATGCDWRCPAGDCARSAEREPIAQLDGV